MSTPRPFARCIHDPIPSGCLPVLTDQSAFEIRWENGDGDVELVGPQISPLRFATVGAAYRHWKRCFAPLCDAPLLVHARPAGGMRRASRDGLSV